MPQATDDRATVERLQRELDTVKRRYRETFEKKEQYVQDLIDADRTRRDLEQQLRDAEDVHREQLREMEQRVRTEERNRPRTSKQEQAERHRLRALRDEIANARTEHNLAVKDRDKARAEARDARRTLAYHDQVLVDFGKAAIGFRERCLLLTGTATALRRVPMTDSTHEQVRMVRELAAAVVAEMDKATALPQGETHHA